MFYFITVGVLFIVLALMLNRMIGNWYTEKFKFYTQEELNITQSLNEAMQKHKMSVIKLRRLNTKIRSYEALLPKAGKQKSKEP